MNAIETLGREAIWLFFVGLVGIVGVMAALLWVGWWVTRQRGSLSPYSRQPMMYGVDLPQSIARHIEEYMKSLDQKENPPFDMNRAAICLKTGRIFPDCVGKSGIIRLGWDFLEKRYPGRWVSWGALPEVQRATIKLCHRSVEGFQLECCSPKPDPSDVDDYYALAKPGPLYVDISRRILLGWKHIPGTTFEVLIVQKPDFDSIDETL
jgi:hypothetical protein